MRPALRFAPLLICLLVLPAACGERFAVDGQRARGRVVHQVEQGPRIAGTPGNAAVREWIAQECERHP